MVPQADHPENDDLRAFHEGLALPEAVAARIAEHMADCDRCQEYLKHLTEPLYIINLRKCGLGQENLGIPEVQDHQGNQPKSCRRVNPDEAVRAQIEANTCYDVVRPLGQGGMSSVYLGVDRQTREKVALKILLAEHYGKQEYVERTRKEVEVLRVLRHPNIVRYIGAEKVGDNLMFSNCLRRTRIEDLRLRMPPCWPYGRSRVQYRRDQSGESGRSRCLSFLLHARWEELSGWQWRSARRNPLWVPRMFGSRVGRIRL